MTEKQKPVKMYGVLSKITLAKQQPKSEPKGNAKAGETDLDSESKTK